MTPPPNPSRCPSAATLPHVDQHIFTAFLNLPAGGAPGESVFTRVLICTHQLFAMCGRLLGTVGPLWANFMRVSAGCPGGGRVSRGNSAGMTARPL